MPDEINSQSVDQPEKYAKDVPKCDSVEEIARSERMR